MSITKLKIEDLQSRFKRNNINPDCFIIHFNKGCELIKEPYRTNCFGICLVHSGVAKLKTGLVEHTVTAPAIIAMGPNVIRSWKGNKSSFISEVIFFTEDFLNKSATNNFNLQQYSYFDNEYEHTFKISEIDFIKYNSIIQLASTTIDNTSKNKFNVVRNLISVLINDIDDLNDKKTPIKDLVHNNSTIISFKKLLADNFKKERSIKFYAETLFTTSKYLSQQVKQYSGKSARLYIDEIIILEAKILLQNLNLNVAEITDILNFSNQSFFGKFFKKYTGISPLNYRKFLLEK